MGWPAIQGYQNGEQIVASVLNKPLNQLAERTDYLRNLISLHGSTKVVIDATISNPDNQGYPTVGQPVYRASDGTFAKAAGLASENAWFYANQSAMAVGIVLAISGTTATICLYGYHSFGTTGIVASTIIADDDPVSGRYYLDTEYGKLTASPNGPVIYIGDIQIAQTSGVYYVKSILVSPQYRDTGESHIHRSFVISGKPAGGYAVKTGGRYLAYGIAPTGVTPTTGVVQSGVLIELLGAWTYDSAVTYTLNIVKNSDSSSTGWDGYQLHWVSGGDDGSGYIDLPALSGTSLSTGLLTVGTHGLQVRLSISSSAITPSAQTSKSWSIVMPDAARAWVNYYDDDDDHIGYRLNLGMYPAMARYVPPTPANSAAMSVGGVEMRSATLFPTKSEWDILPATSEGGPWLIWYGGDATASNETAPFSWTSDTAATTERNIVLHVNRMRVGPTGFVTSLQVAKGAPFKITSAQTDEDAVQGALQISMDTDFSSAEDDVSGCQVVKKIEGSTFKTGPVVEKIVAGPGVSLSPSGGQGTVTVSVSNAVYAGDFETIALNNAKQDLAGGVFPYTKLLGWTGGSSDIATGFTAKFRVPDHIPYVDADGNVINYKVIVSASIFGEETLTAAKTAAFKMAAYALKDYSCSGSMPASLPTDTLNSSVANPTQGAAPIIGVNFGSSYAAFDPVVLHGFSGVSSPDQLQYNANMQLKLSDGTTDLIVHPGYFVGLKIDRCGLASGSTATPYTSPIGFLSLRWNLVVVE